MSVFDYYEPSIYKCPICGSPLKEWQGKDGPNGLFVWREGNASAVEQRVSEEIKLTPEERSAFSLPVKFQIYSHDCPVHQPIVAMGYCQEGTWSETKDVHYPAM